MNELRLLTLYTREREREKMKGEEMKKDGRDEERMSFACNKRMEEESN